MDPVIEEEKCCRHTVLPGEKLCRIYRMLFNI